MEKKKNEKSIAAGKLGAEKRWAGKDSGNKRIKHVSICLSEKEFWILEEKAKNKKMSKSELIAQAVRNFE